MILNKKSLFGGGLCLLNAAVIVISTSNVVAAESSPANKLYQMHWRITACNRITAIKFQKQQNPKQKLKSSWITDKQYKTSIMEVLGKALADCATHDNEFKNTKTEQIITFEGTEPENYEQKNWNAVMMYNYIDCERRREDYHNVINKITEFYEAYFSNINRIDKNKQLKDFINNAVYVVDYYRKDLHLDRYIRDTCSKKLVMNPVGVWDFKVKINVKHRQSQKLYQFKDTPLFFTRNSNRIGIRAVAPRFYLKGQTWYIAGYKIMSRSCYLDLDSKLGFMVYDNAKYKPETYILKPISKTEEGYEENEKNEEYEDAQDIAAKLETYRGEIFYGLVEVPSLYCD